jgi:hypothetical protein
LVFEMNAVTHIDSQGAHTILSIASQLKDRGVQLLLSNPNRRVSASACLQYQLAGLRCCSRQPQPQGAAALQPMHARKELGGGLGCCRCQAAGACPCCYSQQLQ